MGLLYRVWVILVMGWFCYNSFTGKPFFETNKTNARTTRGGGRGGIIYHK